MRNQLGKYPYKNSRSQALTFQQEEDRATFCQWLVDQPENFPQKVIFGDEKMWPLDRLSANRQNWRYWSEENPHIVDEINNQGGKSFMCSVMMVDGRILEPYWFVTEEGKAFNCDQHAYLDMLEQHFFPQFSARELRKYYFQQDGKFKISICSIFGYNGYLLGYVEHRKYDFFEGIAQLF